MGDSALSRENRMMIKLIREDIKEIKDSINNLSNHYSRRLPGWATAIITILGATVTGLVVAGA